MSTLEKCIGEIRAHASSKKAEINKWFFKTGPGQYGEHDQFIGVTNPVLRAIAKKYYPLLTLTDIGQMIMDPAHELRSASLMILILKYDRAKTDEEKKLIFDFYMSHRKNINNWDLVDISAPNIVGSYLVDKERSILYELEKSEVLWDKRIAVLATLTFIRNKDFKDILILAEKLLNHPHDLMHKAIGWMLREVGKRDFETEFEFLKKHYSKMPRTMLRYAIEKFDEPLRQDFLKGKV